MSDGLLTFLGTGTSQGIPVIGCSCKVCQSKDSKDKRFRTSALIRHLGSQFSIDCGPDFRFQMLRENVQNLDAILITHGHQDHVAGLDDIRPFNFMTDKDMEVYGEQVVLEDLKSRFGYIFQKNKYPGSPGIDLKNIFPAEKFTIHKTEIIPVRAFHGNLPILGFRIGAMAYLTDISSLPEESLPLLTQLKVLVISALHKRKHHSHLNLEQALQVATTIGATKTYFIHLSHSMGLHHEVSKELPPSIALAYDGLSVPF